MSVHYKFKSALEYDTVAFDGLHISVRDLKNAITQQKRIGKNTDFDLQVTNAQTKEVYDNEETLIPKNTSLLIARIPSVQVKPKSWEGYGGSSSPILKLDDGGPVSKAVDLSSLDASEDDKIKAMMSQSTQDYDPSNYIKIRGANQMGIVPPNYRCFKCHQGGHWIKDCPLNQGTEPTIEIKKSTGIPRSFMVPVDGPQVQGAMMTPNGSFAVPVLDHQAYTEKPQPAPPEEKQPEIPEHLLCSLCSDLLTDAVMIPCCGDSYCDECIRSTLLESEEHECPACHERDISPGTLIPNRYLRNSVANFKSSTGYVKRLISKPLPTQIIEQSQTAIKSENEKAEMESNDQLAKESTPPSTKDDSSEKTVIREADSTEPSKLNSKEDFTKDIEIKDISKSPTTPIVEGPPGVSPQQESSSNPQPITNVANAPRNIRPHTMNNHEKSPRRHHQVQKSPTYTESIHRNEDRPGTPTVDEPGVCNTNNICPRTVYPAVPSIYNSGPPPLSVINPMIGMPPPNLQGPPPSIAGSFSGQSLPSTYPPSTQGPLPNFRLPPPGAPPFIQGAYNAPPRPVFDCVRPPASGPTPFPSYPSGPRSSRNREFPRDMLRRGRTPPRRIIDDPLEAFNRMLREKDERVRRAKQRKARSFSRSSSRSFSRSPRRQRSRTPRRRSRSRSRSFSISRSRSRSFSPNPRISPPRQYSPKRSPHRRAHSRYRSPIRSPPPPPPRYRYKEQPIIDRVRDRDADRDREREREREPRGFSREHERDFRDRETRDRDFPYFDGGFERDRPRTKLPWNQSRKDYSGPTDPYYQAPEVATQPSSFMSTNNRYQSRNVYPHHLSSTEHQHPPSHVSSMRRYDDVAPPGTEQPPVPGLENTPRLDDKFAYERNGAMNDRHSPPCVGRDREIDNDKDRKHETYSRTPDRNRYISPRRQSKEGDHEHQLEKHKRRRRDESDDIDKKDYDREKNERKRDFSDDEKAKKNKEKKKKREKREKKEEERKKRKEKREKRGQERISKRIVEERDRVEKKIRDEIELAPEEYIAEDVHKDNNKYHEMNEDTAQISEIAEIPEVKIEEDTKLSKYKKWSDNEESILKENDKNVEVPKIEERDDLYGDLLTEGIDNTVIQNYGKMKNVEENISEIDNLVQEDDQDFVKNCDEENVSEYEDSEKDILELHTNETDLKTDIEGKNEVLVPVPERSKWEVEDDINLQNSSIHFRLDNKTDRLEKSGKVTNEVLKRAENAIFAKAINAIRPIEIKKISLERMKLYTGERGREKKSDDIENIHVTIQSGTTYEDVAPEILQPAKPRLSVKERLGCKVDDLDRIVKIDKPYDRNRSHSLSPLSRRAGELNRNLGQGERRIDIDDRKRLDQRYQYDRHHRQYRLERDLRRDHKRDLRRDNRDLKRDVHHDRGSRREKDRSRSRCHNTDRSHEASDKRNRDKRKLSISRTPEKLIEKDKRKRKEKHEKKKEKVKRRHRKEDDDQDSEGKGFKNDDNKTHKPSKTTDKRKPTLDEANFEPDYDLESESDKEDVSNKDREEKKASKRSLSPLPVPETVKKIKAEEKKVESSSSESSDSSSEEDKRKKKRKKHKKKKSRKDSSSSSYSETESDSSEDEKDRKKRKHKKKQKKRKKSKHK